MMVDARGVALSRHDSVKDFISSDHIQDISTPLPTQSPLHDAFKKKRYIQRTESVAINAVLGKVTE